MNASEKLSLTRAPECVLFIGNKLDCQQWVQNKYGPPIEWANNLDKVTYMKEFTKILRVMSDPIPVVIAELPSRATQVQLLKPVEELKTAIVVLWTSAVNAALPTLIGRSKVVRGNDPTVLENKLLDKILDAEKADAGVHVALYRESGDIEMPDLKSAIKAGQLSASGERAMKLLDMYQVAKHCSSAKELTVQWLWGR